MGKAVLIGSQKRDIGKTVICIKLGMNLSKDKKVLIADLSSGKRKIAEYFNVSENIIYDIKDVLDSTCSLDQAIIEINENLSLLPGPRIYDKLKNISADAFRLLIDETKKSYDVVIADVDKVFQSYIDFNLINDIITINNNDFSCVKEINNDKMLAERYNVDGIYTILNKYNKKNAKRGTFMSAKDIRKMTELNTCTIIEDSMKYNDVDYDFLLSTDESSFNKSIKSISGCLII
ncbi:MULTISPECIES: hypothetical protein [unclassified Sedimentibacter]|uniref:hypothetical protein n=1 Tax=unclassified Sedimentibacter TaxID=2649220 RepID=UPI0027E118FF|nr:hypothetical protein [Sedimentibacter sp. MB35-C1]WMJ75888.1 hypothetical protein RBQ61_09620 [Sedimentibacter sp. MB35-C1]